MYVILNANPGQIQGSWSKLPVLVTVNCTHSFTSSRSTVQLHIIDVSGEMVDISTVVQSLTSTKVNESS